MREWLPPLPGVAEPPAPAELRTPAALDPLNDAAAGRPPWLPFCRSYVGDRAAPAEEWSRKLLYEFRHSVVHCAGVHTCMSRVCHKGRLGKSGYCRLGFWHWAEVPNEEHVWARCHGKALRFEREVGMLPPQRGVPLTEQHHPFFGRTTPGVYACCKCNHDLSVMLRFPREAAKTLGSLPSEVDRPSEFHPVGVNSPRDNDAVAAQMAAEINDATHYITDYAGKVQPHLTSLFILLQQGQQRLEEQFDDDPALKAKGPAYLASRTLFRMGITCQKRVHKSMQEMVNYLLGFPEAYCTHAFRPLYYAEIIAMLERMYPDRQNNVGLDRNHTLTEDIATVIPPSAQTSKRRPTLTESLDGSESSGEHSAAEGPPPSGRPDEISRTADPATSAPLAEDTLPPAKLCFARQREDYECRGDHLAKWPLYFP